MNSLQLSCLHNLRLKSREQLGRHLLPVTKSEYLDVYYLSDTGTNRVVGGIARHTFLYS